MYQPQDLERPQYPMFKKVNGRIISFLSLKAAFAIGAATVFAIIIALLCGLLAQDATVNTTDMERLEAKTELTAERAAVCVSAIEEELASYLSSSGEVRQDLSDEESERYGELSQELLRAKAVLSAYTTKTSSELEELARDDGITRETTDEEIEKLIPQEKIESKEIVPVPMRWAIALVIIGAAVMIFSEFGERSLASKILLLVHYSRAQHTYRYKRLTGSHYMGKETMR